MKKILLIGFAIFLGGMFIVSAFAEGVKKDDILFTRCGLKGSGDVVYFHNMSVMPVLMPLGTEVKVIKVSKEEIVVQRLDDNKKYRVCALSDFWDKFFVRNKNDIGMERLPKNIKAAIENNQVIDGMTKEEVYLSKGCPAYIAWGVKSNAHSLEEVMKSDVWYYNLNSRLRDAVVTFENGRVKGYVDRATKTKMKVEAIESKK